MAARNYALLLQVYVCGLTYSTNTPSTPEIMKRLEDIYISFTKLPTGSRDSHFMVRLPAGLS